MEEYIYTVIGKILVYSVFFISIGFIMFKTYVYLLNFLADRIWQMWLVIEYFYYRSQFKQWLKDNKKSRHPKTKEHGSD